MLSMKAFLKKYSQVPNGFIDDIFKIYGQDTAQTDFVVDLETISEWLDIPKGNLMQTLLVF